MAGRFNYSHSSQRRLTGSPFSACPTFTDPSFVLATGVDVFMWRPRYSECRLFGRSRGRMGRRSRGEADKVSSVTPS